MKPLRLFATNFGPYPTIDWAIPEGVTAIIGQNEAGEGISSNGAGKTMLLSILPLALWGVSSWSDFITAGSDDVCEVGCEFEHAGSRFRVRRTYNPAGKGKTTTDFEVLEYDVPTGNAQSDPTFHEERRDVWLPLSRDTQAATQDLIRNTLGIGEATFHHSVFAAQGARHFADAELTPKERGEILADGLGLDVWDGFREAVAADRLAAEKEEATVTARLSEWADQLEAREEVVTAALIAAADVEILGAALADALEKHAALDNTYRTAREALATRDAAEREVDALLSTVRHLETQEAEARQGGDELVALVLELAEKNKQAAELPAHEAEVARLRGLLAEHIDAVAEKTLLGMKEQEERRAERLCLGLADSQDKQRQERIDKIDKVMRGDGDECDRCGQPVSGGALAAFTESVDAEAREYAAGAEQALVAAEKNRVAADEYLALIAALTVPESPHPSIIEQAETNLANARIAETEAARLAGRVESLSKAVEANSGPEHTARLERAREAHTEAHTSLVTLQSMCKDESAVKELAKETLGAEIEMVRIDGELATARTAHGTATERARALAEIASLNEAAITQQKTLRWELDILRELEKAYGRAGIPVLLLESLYVPQIEREANLVLSAWGVPFTVELVTQKALKSSDRLRDTMEVVVHSPSGPRRYQTFSGGERDRVNVALRVALARTIGSHRGHSLEVFALDELAHLDAAGVEKLAELLSDLQREIPVVWFVSHSSDLNDAFDQRVVVIREGATSRLEVAA